MDKFNFSSKYPDIGNGEAGKEKSHIESAFVEVNTYSFIFDEQTVFITGRKGAGKTALKMKCLSDMNTENGPDEATNIAQATYTDIIDLSSSGGAESDGLITYRENSMRLKDLSSDPDNDFTITNEIAWRLFYEVNLMLRLISYEFGYELSPDIQNIKKFLKKGGWLEEGPIKVAMTTIYSYVSTLKIQWNKGTIELKANDSKTINKFQSFEDFMYGPIYKKAKKSSKRLLDTLSKPICLLVDGLDQDLNLENPNYVEPRDQNSYFGSFVLTTYRMSDPGIHPNVRIKAFLPKAFFDSLSYHHYDHASQVRVDILWQDKELLKIIFDRLKNIYLKENDLKKTDKVATKDVWHYFFPSEITFDRKRNLYTPEGIEYKIKRPLIKEPWMYIKMFAITPRDYISICSTIFRHVFQSGENFPKAKEILDAIGAYSKNKTQSIIKEVEIVCPEASSLISYFENGDRTNLKVETIISNSIAEGFCDSETSAKEALRSLYTVGFIGVEQRDQMFTENIHNEKANEVLEQYYDDNPLFDPTTFETVCVNLAFQPFLNLGKKQEIWENYPN